ncbi:MAG: dephospho-CoA kinase [Opitutaceae bacterium]|nr:dephospho-CoA kinase [Opitutaceae bacterium]
MSIGITGGMGCGKSTAARMVAAADFRLIDADAMIREQVLTTADVVAAVRAKWDDAVLGENGKIDRRALAERVFGQPEELAWLESLTHPRLFDLWRADIADKTDQRRVFEVPLLFEKQLENWFDFTVCVACSPSQQLARLEQRGMPRALAEQRISQQLPLATKLELSDIVLWNDGSTDFLQAQVDRMLAAMVPGCAA